MSEFTTAIVRKPKWFKIAPLLSGYGKRDIYVLGFDSEAYRGAPFLFQFAHPDGQVDLLPIGFDDRKRWSQKRARETSLDDLLEYLEPITEKCDKAKLRLVVVGWNLRYEYTQLFSAVPREAFEQSEFVLHWHDQGPCETTADDDWNIRLDALNDKRYSFSIDYGHSHRRRVVVVDGMAWFNSSLDAAAKMVGVGSKKPTPASLGNVAPATALADDLFIAYAREDAIITQRVGQIIVDNHKQYDVRLTLSAPMFAAYVFRRKYLNGEIPLCDEALEQAGLEAYHGGKNGCYIDRPTTYTTAFDYDLNGAYTSAMSILPDPVSSVWYETKEYIHGTHALYYVLARVQSCIYRSFQETNGRWYTWKDDGDLGFWITSYELDAALAHNEIRNIYSISGWQMVGPEGGSLHDYCKEMANRKRYGATPEERLFAKLCLNSLYGKMIQKVPNNASSVFPSYDWVDEDGQRRVFDTNMVDGGYKAGGLYHPAMAALITGNVRARIHKLEHKYNSLMTSTDGLLSTTPPDLSDIGPDIGQLKMKEGTLRIWRERLYHFTPTEGDPLYALHGFRGKVADLLNIPTETGTYGYTARKVISLRDSLRKQNKTLYRPGEFVDLPFELDLVNINDRSPLRPVG